MAGEVNTQTTKPCKHCSSQILLHATRCPQCHGDLRNWFARHKILTGIGILILLSIILGSTGDSTSKDASTVDVNDTATEDVITISAYTLSKEYDANKVAADAKYKDKIVRMDGIVDNIGKDIVDTPYVTLEGISTSLFGIQCMFSRNDEPLLAQLSSGQSITLQGRVSGELIGNVVVKGCKIVE